jgi:V/A-type H+-transporting ATPase subunit E
MISDSTTASGVQQLIDRLQNEGVRKGQAEADAVLVAARAQAMKIVDEARHEADQLVKAAQQESERTRKNGEDAVRLAGRDAILHLTEELRKDFERKLQKLVGHTLQDTEFLKQLILEVARKAMPEDAEGRVNVLLPADQVTSEELSQKKEKLPKDSLAKFVVSLGGAAVRDGLTFAVAESGVPGIRVQIVDDDLQIDLTTDTLTHFLLQHLTPRFQAIMQQS